MKRFQQVYSGDQLTGPAYTERVVRWPGGRGILSIDLSNKSGSSAKVRVGGVNSAPEDSSGGESWGMLSPALSAGGVSEITVTGDYLVELPPCSIQFIVQLDAGHTLTISQAYLIPMEH